MSPGKFLLFFLALLAPGLIIAASRYGSKTCSFLIRRERYSFGFYLLDGLLQGYGTIAPILFPMVILLLVIANSIWSF
jgi:uncharacterized membrane protein